MLKTKLALARERKQMTQKEAAQRAGVPLRTWQGWELRARRRVPDHLGVDAIRSVLPTLSRKDLTTDPYKEVDDE